MTKIRHRTRHASQLCSAVLTITLGIPLVWVVLSGSVQAQVHDCGAWNTEAFFEGATAEDVQRCLASGVNIEARDEFGFTPLASAVWADNVKAMKELIDADARLDVRGSGGGTPLHIAAARASAEAVILLLDAGADASVRAEGSGATPFDLAGANDKLEGTKAYVRLRDGQ